MAWSIILAEGLTITLIVIFANNVSFVALCMGRRELFYSYDYFHPGGFSKLQGYQSCNGNNQRIYLVACNTMRIVNYLIWSNVIDFYFLLKIMLDLKRQTISVKKLLTPKALTERKRYFLNVSNKIQISIFSFTNLIIRIYFQTDMFLISGIMESSLPFHFGNVWQNSASMFSYASFFINFMAMISLSILFLFSLSTFLAMWSFLPFISWLIIDSGAP